MRAVDVRQSFFAVASFFLALEVSASPLETRLATAFTEMGRPFVERFCLDCHSGPRPKAKFDLSPYETLRDTLDGAQYWELVWEALKAGDMPPEEEAQPTEIERQAMLSWIEDVRAWQSAENAGDPGPILARRLSAAEYNYSIRDLTGIDSRPAKDFPVDAANQAGFDNSGESLTMSPSLLSKYLDAARRIADSMVLTPSGLAFAEHSVVSEIDRDRYAVHRIVDFYRAQPTDLAAYFRAAWRTRREPNSTPQSVAESASISEGYLQKVVAILGEPTSEPGPVAELQERFTALLQRDRVPDEAFHVLRDWVLSIRAATRPQFDWFDGRSIHKGAQAFVLWRNDRYAETRHQVDPSRVPAEALASHRRFAAVFPDTFLILERGREYTDRSEREKKGRYLSAGFHSMMGYYRDDQPLYDLLLDDQGRTTLDQLWDELEFVTELPTRQYIGFLWFERTDSGYLRDPEFDFARPENPDALLEPNVLELAERYRAKAVRSGLSPRALEAIDAYFLRMNTWMRDHERAQEQATAKHLEALFDFARRAYRRSLTAAEEDDLRAFYQSLREQHDRTHVDAVRDMLVSVLLSPHFLYRVEPTSGVGDAIRDLSPHELASRLSYFLWSSLPDEPLLAAAEDGSLTDPEVLQAQARRMLRDPKSWALAVEFGANWLDVRRFQSHNAVDRTQFPAFDDALREAMFQEPLRLIQTIAQEDRPLTDLLFRDQVLVNRPLARHYGLPFPDAGPDTGWAWVDGRQAQRGGLPTMAVFLTKNAPGLRTSPVKRGHWLAVRVLGEHIPPPPPDVPELPANEADLGELTLAQALARHRDHESCRGCHERFDPLGLAMENYGPVGEWRLQDLGGREVSSTTVYPDGMSGTGLQGLRRYLETERRDDFIDNVIEKLFAYALGRSLILSDNPTIAEMKTRAAAQDFRFQTVIESIVTSPQFTRKRVQDTFAQTP